MVGTVDTRGDDYPVLGDVRYLHQNLQSMYDSSRGMHLDGVGREGTRMELGSGG